VTTPISVPKEEARTTRYVYPNRYCGQTGTHRKKKNIYIYAHSSDPKSQQPSRALRASPLVQPRVRFLLALPRQAVWQELESVRRGGGGSCMGVRTKLATASIYEELRAPFMSTEGWIPRLRACARACACVCAWACMLVVTYCTLTRTISAGPSVSRNHSRLDSGCYKQGPAVSSRAPKRSNKSIHTHWNLCNVI